MKISIIHDNAIFRQDLESDLGFVCLLEAYKRNVLFDTGGNGRILL